MIIGLSKTASKNKIRKSNKSPAHYSKKKKKSFIFKGAAAQKSVILCVLSFCEPWFQYNLTECITKDICS